MHRDTKSLVEGTRHCNFFVSSSHTAYFAFTSGQLQLQLVAWYFDANFHIISCIWGIECWQSQTPRNRGQKFRCWPCSWTLWKKHMGVNPKIGGFYPPKMDGENFMENPMNKWMIWGGFTTPIFGLTPTWTSVFHNAEYPNGKLGQV